MGVRIMQGDQPYDGAVLYCSTSMWAFGPVFEDEDKAQEFLDWLEVDPRKLDQSQLQSKYHDFLEFEKPTSEEGE
jgi:hypothetical protein